jgi:hypothetical protein
MSTAGQPTLVFSDEYESAPAQLDPPGTVAARGEGRARSHHDRIGVHDLAVPFPDDAHSMAGVVVTDGLGELRRDVEIDRPGRRVERICDGGPPMREVVTVRDDESASRHRARRRVGP